MLEGIILKRFFNRPHEHQAFLVMFLRVEGLPICVQMLVLKWVLSHCSLTLRLNIFSSKKLGNQLVLSACLRGLKWTINLTVALSKRPSSLSGQQNQTRSSCNLTTDKSSSSLFKRQIVATCTKIKTDALQNTDAQVKRVSSISVQLSQLITNLKSSQQY